MLWTEQHLKIVCDQTEIRLYTDQMSWTVKGKISSQKVGIRIKSSPHIVEVYLCISRSMHVQ